MVILPNVNVNDTKHAPLREKAQDFVGFFMAKILTPDFSPQEDDDQEGSIRASYDQLNLVAQDGFGQALAKDGCFAPFVDDLTYSLILTQETANANR